MTAYYPQRREGRIVGLFAGPQPQLDPPTEADPLPADHPDVLGFLSPQADPKVAALAALAAKRWEVETGGIVLDGVAIRTDRESQGLVLGAKALAKIEPDEPVRFKGASGWVDLTSSQVIAIAAAVGRHVRACFRREGELAALIETAADPSSVRIDRGWPPNA